MAKGKGFAIEFDEFLEWAEELDKFSGQRNLLKEAVEDTLVKTRDLATENIIKAMNDSPYAFNQNQQSNKGVGGIASGEGHNRRATGKALKSVKEIGERPVQWDGNIASIQLGTDLEVAPELLILALGTPHIKGDRNLNNAIKVKGKYRKQVSKLQREVFGEWWYRYTQ